jgi:GNAT superfamily N-acetyltransferase
LAIELVPAAPEHVDELGRICFEAFKAIHERHRFPPDFPNAEIATRVIGMLVQRDDCYGVAAVADGRPVGSNFLWHMDEVAGVGPITVDPSYQGRRIGRALMEAVIRRARECGIDKIRLLQDGFNMTSLSLYASLGFDVKEAVALMQAAPARESDGSVRPVTEADLPAAEALCRRLYKTSRRNELASAIVYGFSPLLREREGRVGGYLIPGMIGHGVAETEEDALALFGESARRLPPEVARFFCPLSQAGLYRKALAAGHRTIKVMNLMAMGPYEPPSAVWLPSVVF